MAAAANGESMATAASAVIGPIPMIARTCPRRSSSIESVCFGSGHQIP